MILFLSGLGLKVIEIMDPLLNRDKARPIQPVAPISNTRHLRCALALRVLGPVFISRQITTRAIGEGINDLLQAKRGRQRFINTPGAVQQLTSVIPSQPAPQRERRRRHLVPGAGIARSGSETRYGGPKGQHKRLTEPNNGLATVSNVTKQSQTPAGFVLVGQ